MNSEPGGRRVPLCRPRVTEREKQAVVQVLESGHLARGPQAAALEKEFAALVGGRPCVAVCSGGVALLLALKALGVGPGDEVLVPAFTFPAAAMAAMWLGAIAIPVDCRLEDMAMDPAEVTLLVSERTRCVVVSHQFGIPAPVEEIIELTGLPVVEDAACAAGGLTAQGGRAGTAGDLACFSLHPRKLVTSGEGGVVAGEEALVEKVRLYSDYGRDAATGSPEPEFSLPGLNFRLSDLGAGVARQNLRSLPHALQARRHLAALYRERLDGVVSVPPGFWSQGCTFQTFCIDVGQDRAWPVIRRLRSLGVGASIAAQALTLQKFFQDSGTVLRRACPRSEYMQRALVALPLFEGMVSSDVDLVCGALLQAIREQG